jgi:hypothetical protein
MTAYRKSPPREPVAIEIGGGVGGDRSQRLISHKINDSAMLTTMPVVIGK